MLENNVLEKNYQIFKKKLVECCESINLEILDEFEEKIKHASFSLTNENHTAYDGSLLQIILRILTPYSIKINELLPEEIKVNQSSIIKVCLLSHISKCEMFIPNTDEWQKEKQGKMYIYSNYDFALKMGMRSIIIANQLNIHLTPNEYEAMIVMDREVSDKQSEFYSSPLATVIKQANQLTYLQTRLIK